MYENVESPCKLCIDDGRTCGPKEWGPEKQSKIFDGQSIGELEGQSVLSLEPQCALTHPIHHIYRRHDYILQSFFTEDISHVPNKISSNPSFQLLGLYTPTQTTPIISSMSIQDAPLSYNLHEIRMWNFYDKFTCQIMSCKNAKGENPWRDDLIPRALHSEPLKHALFAMTSFHMKQRQSAEGARISMCWGLNHTNAAFRALRTRLNNGLAIDENVIAAMLVLSFSQVFFTYEQI